MSASAFFAAVWASRNGLPGSNANFNPDIACLMAVNGAANAPSFGANDERLSYWSFSCALLDTNPLTDAI